MLRKVPSTFARFGYIGTTLDFWSRREIREILFVVLRVQSDRLQDVFLLRESLGHRVFASKLQPVYP